jgi:hypothetical protein
MPNITPQMFNIYSVEWSISIADGESIEVVMPTPILDDASYDMQGCRNTTNPITLGIYIMDGRKILIQ